MSIWTPEQETEWFARLSPEQKECWYKNLESMARAHEELVWDVLRGRARDTIEEVLDDRVLHGVGVLRLDKEVQDHDQEVEERIREEGSEESRD